MGLGPSTEPAGAKQITEADRALADLKGQMTKLDRYRKQLSKQNEEAMIVAKTLVGQNKLDRATAVLKLRASRNKMIEKAIHQHEQLQDLVMHVEDAKYRAEVYRAMDIGKTELQRMNELISVEKVEELYEDTQEAIGKLREIDAVLNRDIDPIDDSILEDELNSLVAARDKAEGKTTVTKTVTSGEKTDQQQTAKATSTLTTTIKSTPSKAPAPPVMMATEAQGDSHMDIDSNDEFLLQLNALPSPPEIPTASVDDLEALESIAAPTHAIEDGKEEIISVDVELAS